MAAKAKLCYDCSVKLKKDEIALSRKLIDPDTEEFYCIRCLADSIGCSTEDLIVKIQEFKEQGCTLFL